MSGGVDSGHGGGNVSPMEWLAGRYVPVTTGGAGVKTGNGLAAKSSSVSVTLVIPATAPSGIGHDNGGLPSGPDQ